MASSQCFNLVKSLIYSGSITYSNLNNIIASTGFSKGSLPFNFLGILIFKGRVKLSYLSHIFDIIMNKLIAWKGYLLSMAGRLILVKSIIQGMIYYTINIYFWPVSLLRRIERAIRNFLWTKDIHKRKLLVVAWKKTWQYFMKGGLSICSLIRLNESINLKLSWNFGIVKNPGRYFSENVSKEEIVSSDITYSQRFGHVLNQKSITSIATLPGRLARIRISCYGLTNGVVTPL